MNTHYKNLACITRRLRNNYWKPTRWKQYDSFSGVVLLQGVKSKPDRISDQLLKDWGKHRTTEKYIYNKKVNVLACSQYESLTHWKAKCTAAGKKEYV